MDKTIAMLGGNGYIGTATIKEWLMRDTQTQFIVVSRHCNTKIDNPRVSAVAADCTDADALVAALPQHLDGICCFVGGMDPASNMPPAKVMAAVAKQKGCVRMGYIQGKLGGKDFVNSKAQAADFLREAGEKDGIQTVIVNPTLVYGDGRSDSLMKMVPLLKFCGIFNKNMKPVEVADVAREFVDGMTR